MNIPLRTHRVVMDSPWQPNEGWERGKVRQAPEHLRAEAEDRFSWLAFLEAVAIGWGVLGVLALLAWWAVS